MYQAKPLKNYEVENNKGKMMEKGSFPEDNFGIPHPKNRGAYLMSKIPQVAKSMQKVLNEEARQAGYVTGFVQRESKLSGPLFVQTLTFGFMANPDASLEELRQTAAARGLQISAQGLDQRFNEAAADFLKRVLLSAVKQVIKADDVDLEILQRFNGVKLYDSTTIQLPVELAEIWEGCGGSKGVNAALKLDVCIDLSNGQLTGPFLLDGRSHEASSILQKRKLAYKALRIADLGYFDLGVFSNIDKDRAYWLSQIKARTIIYDKDENQLNLVKLLKKQCQHQMELSILVGQTDKLPARLLAQRVPKKVAKERRKNLLAEAKREGKVASQQRLALANWTIYLTNVPPHLLTLKEAMIIARVRWQIELLFKLWKSHGLIDESRSQKPWRKLCEVYAKMTAMIIQHWILLVACWQYPDRSLFKAVQTIEKMAFHMACVFSSLTKLCQDIEKIVDCLALGCRINKRKANPSTHQLLANTLA
jgi:hypothetical protein